MTPHRCRIIIHWRDPRRQTQPSDPMDLDARALETFADLISAHRKDAVRIELRVLDGPGSRVWTPEGQFDSLLLEEHRAAMRGLSDPAAELRGEAA